MKGWTLEDGVGRDLGNWDCRSPEPFRDYMSLYSRKGLGSGANLPVYTPWRPLISILKLTFPRALHFCPSLSPPALAPMPAPTGDLLAGELVDALDVVTDASVDTIGLGCLVALAGVPRPG